MKTKWLECQVQVDYSESRNPATVRVKIPGCSGSYVVAKEQVGFEPSQLWGQPEWGAKQGIADCPQTGPAFVLCKPIGQPVGERQRVSVATISELSLVCQVPVNRLWDGEEIRARLAA